MEKMHATSILSVSNNVLYPVRELQLKFTKNLFVICKCFDFGKKKFLEWKTVKISEEFVPKIPTQVPNSPYISETVHSVILKNL